MKDPCANLPRFTLFLASLLWAAAFPAAAFAQDSSQNPTPRHEQQHQPHRAVQGLVKSVAGNICKGTDGQLLLRDGKGLYWLDDQQLARKFTGKSVIVTGILDAADNLIRILKIQSAV